MKRRISSHRTEILLGLALVVPLFFPAGFGLKALATLPLAVLPASGRSVPPSNANVATLRDACNRLIRENAELRSRLLALGKPAKLIALDPAYYARNPLRVEAAVVARDASPFRGSIVISAGTREKVRTGFPVVVGDRLVGFVAGTGSLTSRVRLLTDPGSRVWAEILSGKRQSEGAIAGTAGHLLRMERVPAGTARKGDPVFTAGGSAEVPRGLFIGTVVRVEDIDENGVAEIEVKPALAPADLRIVNVLASSR